MKRTLLDELVMTPDEYRLRILDISAEFFPQEEEGIPPRRHGKFVVIRDNAQGLDFLVLSRSARNIFHKDIVMQFCHINQISGDMDHRIGVFVVHDPNWSVMGGGRWEISELDRSFRLFGKSMGYGVCDLKSLKRRLVGVPEYQGWRIMTENLTFE